MSMRPWGTGASLSRVVAHGLGHCCMIRSAATNEFRCWLQKLDNRCHGLSSPWLTGSMSMWLWSACTSSSRVVARGLGWCRCLLLGEAGAGLQVLLLGGAGADLQQVWQAAVSSSHVSATRCSEETQGILRRLSEVTTEKSCFLTFWN